MSNRFPAWLQNAVNLAGLCWPWLPAVFLLAMAWAMVGWGGVALLAALAVAARLLWPRLPVAVHNRLGRLAPLPGGGEDRPRWRRLAWLLFAIALLAFWVVPEDLRPAGTSLDAGWAEALVIAASRHLVYGRDVVFTYGPLGWMTSLASAEGHHTATIVAKWFVLLLAVASLVTAAAELGLHRGWWWLLPAVLLGLDLQFQALLSFVPVATAVVSLRGDRQRGSIAEWLGLAFCTLALLLRLNLAMVAGAALLVIGAGAWVRHGWRAATWRLGIPLVGALILWTVVCGQPLGAIPGFLRYGWQQISSYAAAMQAPNTLAFWQPLMLLCLALVVATLSLWGANPARRPAAWLVLPLVLFYLLSAVKHAAIRCDAGHQAVLPASLGLVALFLGPMLPDGDAGASRRSAYLLARLASLIAVLWLALLPGLVLSASPTGALADHVRRSVTQTERLVRPALAREADAARREQLRRAMPLTRVRETVGDSSVDVYGWELGVLFLHHLAWAPRPTLQSYTAGTPGLAALNLASLHGPGAPDYVLYRHEALDRQYPLMTDGPAIREVFRLYRPLFSEQGFLLLRRRENPPTPPADAATPGATSAGWGDAVTPPSSAPRGCLLLAHIRLTLSGRLRALLLKPAMIELEVTLDDGRHLVYTVTAQSASTGIALDPCLPEASDFETWRTTGRAPRVTGFTFRVAGRAGDYQPRIGLDYQAWPDPFGLPR